MKRFMCIIFATLLMLAVCGCAQTNASENAEVTLIFICGDQNIHAELSDEEAQSVIAILDGNSYASILSGVPSCGFNKNIALKVGNHTYAIACDGCRYIQDLGNLRFFTVSQKEIAYIHGLFESYGGYFPCV